MKKHIFSFLALCAAFTLCLWLLGDVGFSTTRDTLDSLGFSLEQAPCGEPVVSLFGKRFMLNGRVFATVGAVMQEGAAFYTSLLPHHATFAMESYAASLGEALGGLQALFPENQ